MRIRGVSRKCWHNWSRTAAPPWFCWNRGFRRPAGPWLSRLRDEGGRIVVTELPPLTAPHDYAPAVDEVVRAVLGPEALA